MIKVSIIVPIYNSYDFLPRCIDSLINQTLKEIEIILVNDASTDNSLSLLKSYEANQKNIFVVDLPENIKQGGARNAGIQVAKGEYIGFVDSDDWVEEDMYELLYEEGIRSNSEIVDCDYYQKNSKNDSGKKCISQMSRDLGVMNIDKKKRCILSSGRMVTKIYKNELWKDNNIKYPEGLFYEDNEIAALLLVLSKRTSKVDRYLYNYFTNQSSTTQRKNNYRFFDRLITSEAFVKHFKERNLYDTFKNEVDYRFMEFFLINSIHGCLKLFSPREILKIKEICNDFKKKCPSYKDNMYYVQSSFKEKMFVRLAFFNPKLLSILYR